MNTNTAENKNTTSQTTIQENKMGIMPIPKLLFSISFPMIISMLIQALYNIVDSMFVAKLGEDALTAVSLTFPIQNLIIAVAVGTGVGINALISRYLGAKQTELCSVIANNGLLLSLLNAIVFALIGFFFSHTFFAMQTTNTAIVEYGSEYMFIVTVFSIGVFYQITFERFVQSTGQTILNMFMQATGAIINIILDPILIFGLFGFPRLEVAGAAIATVVGQISAAILGLFFVKHYTKEIEIYIKGFRPDKKAISDIYKIGFPAIIMQSIGSIMVLGMNSILLLFSTTAAAVFGIYFKLQSFIFMPIFGMTNGLISIVAYNYGAKKKKRIMATYKLACIVAVIVMSVGALVFLIFTTQLLQLFDASSDMLAIGLPSLRIICFSFPIAGFCIVSSSMFQALGDSVYSLILSVVRQLFLLLPLAYVLANIGGLHSVWFAFPISEIFSALLCVILMKRIYSLKINPLSKM